MSTDSDSSDNEDLELLREAQDTLFLKENLYNADKNQLNLEVKEELLSLRINKNENEQFNCFKVSPGFRNFVAKHLTKILDNKLKNQLEYVSCDEVYKKKRKNSGIRLFSNSEKLLKIEKNQDANINFCKSRYAKFVSKPVSKEDLKILAVSGEDILSNKDTKYWSKRSKSKVFNYKKSKNGKLELIEPQYKKIA